MKPSHDGAARGPELPVRVERALGDGRAHIVRSVLPGGRYQILCGTRHPVGGWRLTDPSRRLCSRCARIHTGAQRSAELAAAAAEALLPVWVTLDLQRPARSLRAAAGLSLRGALDALGVDHGSSVTTAEQRGAGITYTTLLQRAEAYDLELEVRVRRRSWSRPDPSPRRTRVAGGRTKSSPSSA